MLGLRALLGFVVCAWLSACTVPAGHGFIQLDENTDPRIVKQAEGGAAIGTLDARGDQVFLNGRRVTGRRNALSSGDLVRTGSRSFATIELVGAFLDTCAGGVEIRDFEAGRLYGKTDTCSMSVYTDLGTTTAGSRSIEYYVSVAPGGRAAEVVAVSGSVNVTDRDGTPISLRERQAVSLLPGGATRLRELSPREIESLLDWVVKSVPEVVNRSLESARSALLQDAFRPGRTTTRANDGTKTPGVVAAQSPRGGQEASYGSPVDLEVWGPIPEVAVPLVIGQTLESAVAVLGRQGLQRGSVSTRENDGRQKPGTIVAQDPRAGQRVSIRSRVDLEQWGPLPVSVPSVVQRSVRDARAILERSGLRVGSISGVPDPRDDDLVAGQSPTPGTSLPRGSAVELRVTRRQRQPDPVIR